MTQSKSLNSVFKLNGIVSVKEPRFGAIGDGVADDTAAIQAAIDSGAQHIFFPKGNYSVSDTILLYNKNEVVLEGEGTTTYIQWAAADDATKDIIKLQNSSYCSVRKLQITRKEAGKAAGFGIYITSEGAGGPNITQYNKIEKCRVSWCLSVGIQIGHKTVNADVNVDGNKVEDTFISNCDKGLRIHCTNTNMTWVKGGAIASNTTCGVEIGLGARGQSFDNILMFLNVIHFWLRNQISGPISIRNFVTELYNDVFLKADPTAGGVYNYNLLTLENINCTNNNTDPAVKLIDYQGTGSVCMRNSRWGGGASTSGGSGAQLYFIPPNGPSAGAQWLITEATHLYDSANFNVISGNVSAFMKWLELGTSISEGTSAGVAVTGALSNKIRTWRVKHETQLLIDITLAAGGTINNRGHVGRQVWKVTIAKDAWINAAAAQYFYFCTLPLKTAVVGCYCDTTEAFAGLAGTITASVGQGGTPTGYIASHDVKTATITKGMADADLGALLNRAGAVQGGHVPSWTGNAQVYLALTSGTGNLGNGVTTNLTNGTITVYLITETQP